VRDPAFFAEVVALFHRSSTVERREISEEDVDRGQRGYALIESWRTIPGAQEDGSVDGATLREWVLLARSELRKRGLDSTGDEEIGKVLRYSSDDPDGAWPAVAVRHAIEELASEDLEHGIQIEVYNSRGWTSRGPTEGGVQERELASSTRDTLRCSMTAGLAPQLCFAASQTPSGEMRGGTMRTPS
jgi:hypothetical protein